MTVFVMQYGFQLEVIVERFISAFKILSGGDASAEFRGNQLIELLNGWTKKPIFGSGYGATITFLGQEYSSFELSYVATLYHTGLIGFTLYLLLFIWLFLNCFKLISETEPISIWLFPISIALFCFMIANATNPYLQKFDYMWVIFLPLAFINYLQLKKREKIRRVEERLAS